MTKHGMWIALAAALGSAPSLNAQEPVRGPLTLEDAIELAVRRNRDLRDAVLALDGAEQQVREAWGSVYPTLDMTASYTRSLSVPANFLPRIFIDPDADPDELIAVKFGADNSWNFQLRAEQPLFQAGAFIGVGAAGRYERLQQEVVRGRVHAVATRVKVAYYDALLAAEAVRLSENTVRRIAQTLDETRKMNEAGISSDYDVLRLEVELANVEPSLRRSRNAAEASRRTLAVELGMADLDSLRLDGSLFDLGGREVAGEDGPMLVHVTDGEGGGSRREISTQDALDLARANRSDLRQIALTEQLRRTELRVEQAEYLPKVSLFGTYSIVAQQNGSPEFFGESDAQRAYGRQVGVQVTLPLFSGFKRPARVAQREVALEQVREQAALLDDLVENEVKTLFDQVDEARTRSRAQSLALRQAQRGYEIASVQYREGIGSQLELTDAEVALRQSEFNRAEAVYDYLVARARLEEAIGTVPLPPSAERVAFGMESETR